jgi:uncharacterized protein (TIGR00369 family)
MSAVLSTREGLQGLLDASPFHQGMPIEVVSFDLQARLLIMRLAFKPDYQRQPGADRVHGGVVATLVDVAGAFAMIGATGANTPTISLQVEYLRPATPGSDLIARAQVRHVGRTVGFVDVEVTDRLERLVALGRLSMSTAAADPAREGT